MMFLRSKIVTEAVLEGIILSKDKLCSRVKGAISIWMLWDAVDEI